MFEYCHVTLTKVMDIEAPPIPIFSDPNVCTRCVHYTRIPPNCDCMSGYKEANPGDTACVGINNKFINTQLVFL